MTNSSSLTPVTVQVEMQILAYLARGDLTQAAIAKKFGVDAMTITNIKKRNPDTLALLKDNLLKHRMSMASGILDKANKAIEQRLEESESSDTELDRLQEQYRNGEIDEKVFSARVRRLQKLSVTELTAISREMHSQVRHEGPDKTPAMNPLEAQEYLVGLAKGLDTGDEVVLERLIFRKENP